MHKLKKRSAANVIGFTLSGKLTREEYRKLIPVIEEKIKQFGKVRLLIELDHWDGWESYKSSFDDFLFGLKNSFKIERVAFVVKSDVDKQSLLLDKPFSPWFGKNYRYFSYKEKKLAWAWVQEGIEHLLPNECRPCFKIKKARYGAKQKVLIVGGGLTGLTMGALLRNRRFNVTILEKNQQTSASKGLCVLFPNATDVFKSLGVYQKVLDASEFLTSFQIFNYRGDLMHTVSFDRIIEKYGPISIVPKNTLIEILSEVFTEKEFKKGLTYSKFSQQKNDIKVDFTDNSSASFDYVIACDGATSKLRNKVFGDIAISYSGYVSWRFAISKEHCSVSTVSEFWSADRSIALRPFGDMIYGNASCKFSDLAEIPNVDSKTLLKNCFEEFEGPVKELLKNIDKASFVLHETNNHYNVQDITSGRFALLGDAGYAFHPKTSASLAFTMEMVSILGEQLSRSDSRHYATPLEAYQKRARKRYDFLFEQWRNLELLPYYSVQHRIQVTDLCKELPNEEAFLHFWDQYLSEPY